MILTNDNYPIFEADQVLSQKHLNTLISFLEEQDRASHIHLLGMGIACGLEIGKPNTTTIQINCGSALTSLGYLIPLDSVEYTHYKETTIAENFLTPDLEKQPYLSSLYGYTQRYEPFKNCQELLHSDAEDEDKQALTATVLENKVVMLLLEAALIDEKNCVTVDCADKGKRLQFKARPLLIEINTLIDSDFVLNQCSTHYFDNLVLSKYNVPKTKLVTASQVLDGIDNAIVKNKQKISDAIEKVHDHYLQEFGTIENYSKLNNVITTINSIHSQNQNNIYVQYVWDWVQDLAAAYNEIASFHKCNHALCCPDKSKFPFHVLLGTTEFSTANIPLESQSNIFRTPFIKTGILSEEQKQKKEILKGLLERLIHLVNSFSLQLDATKIRGIKITPSLLGSAELSTQAMPYYYTQVGELNEKWSPDLTLKNKNKQILSYHANLYNSSDDHVRNPINYDTEPYDFFKIEGHIGQDYDQALTDIIAQQQQYRLPFKVVALNAVNFEGKNIDIASQTEIWDDMELDYDLAKEKVYNITEYVITWIKDNKEKIQAEYPSMTDVVIISLEGILVETRSLLVDSLEDFLPNYEQFYEVFDKLNSLFLSHRLCISLIPDLSEKSIIEDFVDHLDEINMLFLEDPFTIIHEEANRRWEANFKETFLSTFLEKHTAINHRAGVSRGGTFVMVYKDNSVFEKRGITIDTSLLLGRIDNYMQLFNFDATQRQGILAANVVKKRAERRKYKATKTPINDQYKKTSDRVRNEVLIAAKESMQDLPKSTREFVTNKMITAFDASVIENINVVAERGFTIRGPERSIPEQKIIADFYLPYICCGKGENINIVIPPIVNEPIVADFEGTDFDGNDFFTNDQ